MLIMFVEPLCNFIHSNLTLNLLSSKLNQKFRHVKPIYILQTYLLPQDGRKEVHVQIKVSQEEGYQFDEIVPCDQEKIVVTLRGSGEEEIKVYFDGELELSHIVQISE